jgi:polyribonucleotide nucleotidyltransferase
MKPETKSFQLEIGGKTVTVETGKYGGSTNGSVTVRCGDTMLFVHCCVSKEPRVGIDFFPLLIDYEERMSAIGRIPGRYNRTEGKVVQLADKIAYINHDIENSIRAGVISENDFQNKSHNN